MTCGLGIRRILLERAFRSRLWRVVCPGIWAAMLLSACTAEAPASRTVPSVLDPQGEGARIVSFEWWVQLTLAAIIFAGVLGLLLAVVIRDWRRKPGLDIDLTSSGRLAWIWIGGVALPLVVLSVVLGFSLRSAVLLAEPPEAGALTVEVVGHRWWWEVRYPNEGIVTANEIHVPAGSPVRIELTSADVIHSFWVPQVAGKIDLIPGQTTSTWVQANNPGIYRGMCAEFCGLQHAHMHFMLVAQPQGRFESWVQEQQQPAVQPETELAQRGQQVFLASNCVYCHSVRGTRAAGTIGPDLTHIGSRLTLGAGVLDNTIGNLGGWVTDPQHVKPGVLMPRSDLSGEDLQALLAYLTNLK